MFGTPVERAVAKELRNPGAHVSLIPPYKFAKQLMKYRRMRGWGPKELAGRVQHGITADNIRSWESAKAFPMREDINRLAWTLAPYGEKKEVASYWIFLVDDAREYITETGWSF